jgi:uncharacterized Zn-finger protein
VFFYLRITSVVSLAEVEESREEKTYTTKKSFSKKHTFRLSTGEAKSDQFESNCTLSQEHRSIMNIYYIKGSMAKERTSTYNEHQLESTSLILDKESTNATTDDLSSSADKNLPHCAREFGQKGTLFNHVKVVHDDKIKEHKCSHCQQTFTRKHQLFVHVKAVHDRVRDMKCSQCDYASARKDALNRHIKAVHNKILNRKCSYCGFATSRRDYLKRHILTVHGK